jgi:hypothetical protein
MHDVRAPGVKERAARVLGPSQSHDQRAGVVMSSAPAVVAVIHWPIGSSSGRRRGFVGCVLGAVRDSIDCVLDAVGGVLGAVRARGVLQASTASHAAIQIAHVAPCSIGKA